MNKQDFLAQLRTGLAGLPQADLEDRLMFYEEMIDDRIEEGCLEEEAVSEIGPIEGVISQIVSEIPLMKLVKEKITKKKRMKVWEIILLALGSPIWLSLLIAVFAVLLSLYVSLWSVIISLWAVFGAFVGCAVGGVLLGIQFAFSSGVLVGLATVGAGFVCAGLSIFLFYGCKAATKGILILTKKMVIWMKKCFIKKEEIE